ncbi:hypothetical protein [Gynuella sp.]|uniref:hypothetical protein n=1 Tax=Gynuella sp. TaxID=2969146 RepID=UPI003D0E8AA2
MTNSSALDVLAFIKENPSYHAVPGLFISESKGTSYQMWAAVNGEDVFIPRWDEILTFVPDGRWAPISGSVKGLARVRDSRMAVII